MDWFRSHHGAPLDAKHVTIAKRSETQPGVSVAIWWALLDFASQHEDRGSLAGLDAEVVANFFGWDVAIVRRVIEVMGEMDLVSDDRITNWEKRQPKREDDSTPRVREYRARQKRTRNTEKHNETADKNREEQIIHTAPEALAAVLPDDTHRIAIDRFLAKTGNRAPTWRARLAQWLSGHDFHPTIQCDTAILAAALGEYVDDPGDYSVAHVRSFVLRIARQWSDRPALPATSAAHQQDAERIWRLCKESGVLHATTATIDGDLARLVASGQITNAAAFRATLKKLDMRFLRTAQSDRAAIASIAEKLAA